MINGNVKNSSTQPTGRKNKSLLFILLFIVLSVIGFSFYYYEMLRIKMATSKQENIALQQDLDVLKQNKQEEARKKSIALLSKNIPVGNIDSIDFYEGNASYTIGEVTKYWIENPSESKDFSLQQTDLDGIMRNHDYHVPPNKSVIVVSVFITNNGESTYTFPADQIIRPIFTTPDIRAKSGEGKTELVDIILVSVPPKQSYEYKFLFFADYEADRTFIRYGRESTTSTGGLLIDFNQN